ncbi:hypothetical protein RJ641_020204 [Dillenia turbinata]|uniref:Uncharacterized protein n=1 Tax=Dillenia turbinata TaxID=194707 RepID=A0AAN8UT45_9MAGN
MTDVPDITLESTNAEEIKVKKMLRECLDLRESYVYRENIAPWTEATGVETSQSQMSGDPFHFDSSKATSEAKDLGEKAPTLLKKEVTKEEAKKIIEKIRTLQMEESEEDVHTIMRQRGSMSTLHINEENICSSVQTPTANPAA